VVVLCRTENAVGTVTTEVESLNAVELKLHTRVTGVNCQHLLTRAKEEVDLIMKGKVKTLIRIVCLMETYGFMVCLEEK
jgi:hypothetical protein